MVSTPKGFRDFVGPAASKREFVLGKLKGIFQKYGFEPLETPALEFAETLTGKYGEEEKLIYQFETKGGDKVALRYDQTVPFARVLASYQDIPKPYKRYQIQNVWRGENTQKGRYREFLQCDIDIAGTSSLLADAEIIALVIEATKALGFKKPVMKINDRALFADLESKYVAAIDKLDKIGAEGVVAELAAKGLPTDKAQETLDRIKNSQKTDTLVTLFDYLGKLGVAAENIEFDPTLARGLNYYTGPIFELKDQNYPSGSLGGGGRYDTLLSILGSTDIPATGFSFGFDRLIEAMQELNLLGDTVDQANRVLVTVFNSDLLPASLAALAALRTKGVSAEIYLTPESKFDKQLKYADQKGFRWALIIGPGETEKSQVNLKNLQKREQSTVSLDEAIATISAS